MIDIYSNIMLSCLAYSMLLMIVFKVVVLPKDNPITQFLQWSSAFAFISFDLMLMGYVFGCIWTRSIL